jgi:hypothetical protein
MKHWGTITNDIVTHVKRPKNGQTLETWAKLLNEWIYGMDGI